MMRHPQHLNSGQGADKLHPKKSFGIGSKHYLQILDQYKQSESEEKILPIRNYMDGSR